MPLWICLCFLSRLNYFVYSCVIKRYVKCFYIAQYPVRWTAQNALHFAPPWKTRSFLHQLGFSGKHPSHTAITLEDHSIIFPPLSIARYSFIQLSQLGRHGENENAQTLQWVLYKAHQSEWSVPMNDSTVAETWEDGADRSGPEATTCHVWTGQCLQHHAITSYTQNVIFYNNKCISSLCNDVEWWNGGARKEKWRSKNVSEKCVKQFRPLKVKITDVTAYAKMRRLSANFSTSYEPYLHSADILFEIEFPPGNDR